MTRFVYTSANLAYGPKVAALAESVKRHEPDAHFVWVLVEEPGQSHLIPSHVDEILSLDVLGARWTEALRGRPVHEACTAVKGAALAHLLSRPDCESAVYLDPDIYVYAPLTPVWDALSGHSIALTPHMLEPSRTPEGIRDNEINSLKHGIFNLGFIGVRADKSGRDFADWWDARLHDYCLIAPELGLWTDQKWIDHVPIFFQGVHVVRHQGCNVAAWNIGERDVSERDGRIWVGDSPLVFFHFSSVDHPVHRIMLDKYALNDVPARISDQYRTALAGYEAEYGWAKPWSLIRPRTLRSELVGLARRIAYLPLRVMSVRPIAVFVRRVVPQLFISRLGRWLRRMAGIPAS